jgi:trehalose-6-phosphate synthase
VACTCGISQAKIIAGCRRCSTGQKKKKNKQQIEINHTQEGIGHGCQPAEQVEGEQWEGRGGRKGKKHSGMGEKPQHHHHTKSEQHRRKHIDLSHTHVERGDRKAHDAK